jgi:hypothetical protein
MDSKWVVVQHSGYGYRGDETFKQMLETRMVTGKKIESKVTRAGGILFDSYGEAEDFAEAAMYPPESDNGSLIGKAQGTFSNEEIDGLAIYVPVRKVVG